MWFKEAEASKKARYHFYRNGRAMCCWGGHATRGHGIQRPPYKSCRRCLQRVPA